MSHQDHPFFVIWLFIYVNLTRKCGLLCVKIVMLMICDRFWFVALALLSGLALVYSVAVLLLPSIRETILIRRFRFGTPAGVTALIRKTQVTLLHNEDKTVRMETFPHKRPQIYFLFN